MIIEHSFPTEAPFGVEDVERRFVRCLATRSPDPSFHFSLTIPREWCLVDAPADHPSPNRGAGTIALFRTSKEPRAEMEVSVAFLPREIAPSDWLDCYLEARGEAVLHRRTADSEGGMVADVLSRRSAHDGGIVSRWLTIKDGKRLFILQARAPEAHYQQFANAFCMAVDGFELLHQGRWPLAESLKTFTRRDPGDFLLLYPESWQMVEDASNNANALAVHFRNVLEKTVVGQVTFATVARSVESDPQRLASAYHEALVAAGVPLDRLVISPSPPIDGFEETWRALAEADGRGGSAEVRTIIGKRPDAWFFIGLVGPSRRTDAEVWAVNKRAFDIVLTYLKTPDLSLEDVAPSPGGP